MKHLAAIQKESERIAGKLDLKVDQVSAFGDGTYRMEFSEKPVIRQIGFVSETGKTRERDK